MNFGTEAAKLSTVTQLTEQALNESLMTVSHSTEIILVGACEINKLSKQKAKLTFAQKYCGLVSARFEPLMSFYEWQMKDWICNRCFPQKTILQP